MKKYFVFADVHSFYDELMTALNNAGFEYDNKDHIIISLGDLCDRGNKSKEVLEFVNSLPEERKICIIGNHELLMEDYIRRGYAFGVDISNGTVKTAIDISEENECIEDLQENRYWSNYKKTWRYYYEMDNCIFVHGWIPFVHNTAKYTTEYCKPLPDWRNASRKQFEDASWENGMYAWSQGIREEGKTTFCGHWHASWGHSHLHNQGVEFPDENKPGQVAIFDPFIDEGIVALDACTAYSHKVNVYTIESADE